MEQTTPSHFIPPADDLRPFDAPHTDLIFRWLIEVQSALGLQHVTASFFTVHELSLHMNSSAASIKPLPP